jgi:PAS domain S-box-containing protein
MDPVLGKPSPAAHEIAERKTIEAELRDSQQRLLLALEAGRLGTWELDPKTNRVQWSALMEPMHGFAPGTFGGTLADVLACIHPEDQQKIMVMLPGVLTDMKTHRLTYRVILPDGRLRWIEGVGQAFRDETGQATRLLGVCSDVTERKQAEIALGAAEERFRSLAMYAPVGIAQSDAEGRTFFVNPKWCEIAGAQPAEVMGYGWKNFLHPDDGQKLIDAWQAAMEAGQPFFSAEFRFLHKDGSVRWCISSATLLKDAQGTPIGQIGSIVDITDRKAADEVIRASEAQLHAILDNTTAVIYLKDTLGRYITVNRRWEELFHVSREEIAGQTGADVFPPEVMTRLRENDRRVREAGQPLEFEEVIPHDGEQHTYISVKFPIKNDRGEVVAVGGVSTDISELKRTAGALQAEQELLRTFIEVQENEKKLICYEIHDGVIQYTAAALMMADALQQSAAGNVSLALDDIIASLRRAIDEGRRVIQGVRSSVLDDAGLVEGIEDLIHQLDGTGLVVEFDKDPQIGRLPKPHETAIYRVVQEALTNAKKHSGSQRVHIELRQADGQIHAAVRDFGCGFDVPASRRKGFGLLGMTERVRLLGGRCSIESQPGSGTTVLIQLPVVSESAP